MSLVCVLRSSFTPHSSEEPGSCRAGHWNQVCWKREPQGGLGAREGIQTNSLARCRLYFEFIANICRLVGLHYTHPSHFLLPGREVPTQHSRLLSGCLSAVVPTSAFFWGTVHIMHKTDELLSFQPAAPRRAPSFHPHSPSRLHTFTRPPVPLDLDHRLPYETTDSGGFPFLTSKSAFCFFFFYFALEECFK